MLLNATVENALVRWMWGRHQSFGIVYTLPESKCSVMTTERGTCMLPTSEVYHNHWQQTRRVQCKVDSPVALTQLRRVRTIPHSEPSRAPQFRKDLRLYCILPGIAWLRPTSRSIFLLCIETATAVTRSQSQPRARGLSPSCTFLRHATVVDHAVDTFALS
jgi:hypothetical protein